MDFLGDRLDELVRGWKKASAVKQKLLLKRALLGVVVSATETKIIYLNSGQQESDLVAGGTEESSFETEVLGKIVNGIGSDTKKPSRDEKVLSAFRIKIGRGDRIRTCDPLVPNQMRYQTALLPDREGKLQIVGPFVKPLDSDARHKLSFFPWKTF